MKFALRFMMACLVLVGLLGSACSKKDNLVRVAVFTSDPVVIKILNGVMRDIEKKHPGLEVRLENIPYGSFQDKITTEIVAGQPPDIVSVEVNNFVDLYMKGAFEDLTPYVQRDGVDTSAYYETIMKRFSPGGKVYALPTDIAPTGVVYYNKKMFREAGIPYPDMKKNWQWPEPFLSICKKLVKRDANGKITRWAYADPYNIDAVPFMLSNGGYFMDSEENPTRLALDSPQAMQAYKFRWDMVFVSHVSPTMSEVQSFNFGNGSENMFVNGQIAMLNSGIWHTPTFLQHKDLDFDIVQFPKGPRGTKGWGTGGTGYAITKLCKHKENAWLVVKELAGERVEQLTAQTGLIQPAMISVAKSDAFLKSPGAEHKYILLDMPNDAHFGPFVKGWNEIWFGQVGPAMDSIWLGNNKPEQVLRDITARVNAKYFGVK
jgi:ABC-type glycerol-3-phosphate transport system substrate-binding protein